MQLLLLLQQKSVTKWWHVCSLYIRVYGWVFSCCTYFIHGCVLVSVGGGKRTIYIFCALHFDYISFVVGQYTRIFSGAYLHFPIHRCFTNKQDDEVQEKEQAQQRELTGGGGNFMFSLDFFCTIIIAVFPLYFPHHPFKFGFCCFFHHTKIIVFYFFIIIFFSCLFCL